MNEIRKVTAGRLRKQYCSQILIGDVPVPLTVWVKLNEPVAEVAVVLP